MAKNVKIIPASDSVEFDNGNGSKIIYTISGSVVEVTNERGDSLMEMEDSDTKTVNISNDATIILPTQAGAPANPTTGAISFDSNTNSIAVGDSGSGKIELQGPQGSIGPTGIEGPKGNTAIQGPKGLTGLQGPEGLIGDAAPQGAIGPKGLDNVTGPKGNTGSQGPEGLIGPQGPEGLIGNIGLEDYC